MTCWAVLMGVPRTDLARVPLPSARAAIRAMKTFLEARDPDTRIEYLEDASIEQVRASFDAVRASIAETEIGARDTLLVMFAGHGILGAPGEPDGWALRSEDWLSDRALLGWLRSSPNDLRKIVISDCCYGLSVVDEYSERLSRLDRFARRLARMPRRISYNTLALRFVRRLMMRSAVDELPPIPLICLAAASSEEQVLDGGERLFTTLTIGASGSGHTYRLLQKDFDLVRRTTTSFHVVASPPERLDEIVLGNHPASPALLRVRPPIRVTHPG